MLHVLIVYVFRALLILLLLVGTAILIGTRQPPSAWSLLFRLNDCQLPCWLGIEPGTTTLAEAQRQLEAAYADTSLYQLEVQQNGRYKLKHLPFGYSLGIALDTGDRSEASQESIIQGIYFQPLVTRDLFVARPSIAELYSPLGDAEAMQRITGFEISTLGLFFRARQVAVFFDEPECDRVMPAQPIRSLQITHQPMGDNTAWLSPPMRWQGFQKCHTLELQLYP